MKLSHGFGLLAAGFGTVGLMAFAGVTGCSSSSSTVAGDAGSSGSSGGNGKDLCSQLPASDCLPPPPVPTGAPMQSHPTPHNYALHKLFLGDTDRSMNPSMTAWQSYGYNLDGKVTTASSTDVCTLVPGSSKQVQVDGNGGIDNSFGSQIMPIIITLDATASQTLNDDINTGSFTVMTYVVGFDDSASNTTTATGLTGVLLAGAKYSADGGVPAWNTTTNWPVLPDQGLISGCTSTGGCPSGTDPIANAVVKFNGAFQTKGTFVSGAPNPLTLSLSIGGQELSLNIASAVISFDPLMPGSVTNGTIAGVLDTTQLIAGLMNVAGNISTSLCSGSAFQSIAMQIEQTSDILLNGTTVSNTSGSQCNAISIGLGFSSDEIAIPNSMDIAPGAPAAPSKCADGG
jgi:hypothetical protein